MANGKELKELTDVTVRFAGDSGDGMQLTGTQFSDTSALAGNDLATLPDYPAEIRAPAGTLYGVSGFQLHFGSSQVYTPGDSPDVLVAMNPAALKVNITEIKPHALIIVNEDAFDLKSMHMAGFENNPLEDDTLSGFKVFKVPVSKLTTAALEGTPLSSKEVQRSKNFFALGMMYWLYNRKLEPTMEWVNVKFGKKPDIADANIKALKAGYYYGETTELFTTRYSVQPAKLPAGTYRNISGNEAVGLGFVAAKELSGLNGYLGSYPITPASDILHYLAGKKNFNIKTVQAEDEIAGITSAIGASYAGSLALTTTSGPGLALKTEALGLAIITELPLVIVNVQRGGPSTGLPTKTEQSDLLQAVLGRNGDAPMPVLAASTPSNCFSMTVEACRIALKYMTPVILLTDGYIANGSEPWLIPNVEDLPKFEVKHYTNKEDFAPYKRNEFGARPWVKPGTPGLEHRIGGLEKADITGDVSYNPDNHHKMTQLRAEKVEKIKYDIPEIEVDGDEKGKLLVLGWGGTYGSIKEAVNKARAEGMNVSCAHLHYVNPFPKNLGEVLNNFEQVLIPEINMGQLAKLIRSEFLIPAIQYNVVRGLPFKSSEIKNKIAEILGGNDGAE